MNQVRCPSLRNDGEKGDAQTTIGKTGRLESKGQREGWLRYVRQGEGEEADERAIMAGCRFDPRRADHWLEFADKYGTLTEGPWKGKPFTLLPWQQDATARFFGWVKFNEEWDQEVRRFRFLYLEVPKKNGKTPLLSLIGNYLLFGDSWERQINLYLAATTRKQAERCLTHAIRQIRIATSWPRWPKSKSWKGSHRSSTGTTPGTSWRQTRIVPTV